MHIETAVHTDPENHERFTKWINSRDYGGRPFIREWRFYDIAIQEVHKDKLLADLKWYHKEKLAGGFKTKFLKKILNFFIKRLGFEVIDMSNVERTPEKWFEPIKWHKNKHCTHAVYLEVIGGFKDSFDKTGHESI